MGVAHHNPGRPARVVVVDDSPDVHRLLKARLRSENLEIVGIMDSTTAFDEIAADLPEVVMLDLEMPGKDGYEVLRELKSNERTRLVPVVILSGVTTPEDKVMAFDLGAMDYVTKPFDLMELIVRVRSALSISRLLQMLSERAHVDGLTALGNRANFDDRWREAVASASRHSRPLSLAMLDADHFKSINDTFGHPAGDCVLQGISGIITSQIREIDIACRYGGEEFAIIMPDCTPEDAEKVCERILEALRAHKWQRHPERAVTASIGVCGSAGRVATTHEQWLQTCDETLYKSKRTGRNRITTVTLSGGAAPLSKAS